MKKNVYFIAAAILAFSCSHSEKTHQTHAEKVDVASVVTDSVTIYKNYPGTLTANREVQLVARVNGYLRSKNYQSGSYVRQGDVLFTIEDGNYRDAVSRAQSDVATAEANLNYARSHYHALCEAQKSDAVSRMEVEQGLSTLNDCEASLASARANLKTARTQLSYCTVRAPFNGHITAASYDVGAYLGGEGAPVALAEIFEDDTMIANFAIDDASSLAGIQRNIKDGDVDYNRIPLNFSDTLSHRYTAQLDYLSPKVSTSTGTVQLQAVIDNPDGELRSGMFVSVDLPAENEPHALLIKDASISSDQLGKYVYVVNDSNKVVYTPINVGPLVNDSMRVVQSGLNPGQKYVTKAMLKVRDGMTVSPNPVK